MDGKTVLITGGSDGIGFEAALELANRGARVIIASRQSIKGEEAVRLIVDKTGNKEVYHEQVDLADRNSVRQLSHRICSTQTRLDVLINNAAISGSEELQDDVNPDVYDRVFAVNYLGHFLLVYELLPLLIRSSPSRIVSVTSIAHAFIKTPLLNFDSQSHQSRSFCENLVGYDASKLAMVLHIKELSRILGGSGVTANCVHPGIVYTNLWRQPSPTMPSCLNAIVNLAMRPLFMSARAAAQTIVYCCVADEMASISGKYLRWCRVSRESAESRDVQAAAQLWHVSMLLTGCVREGQSIPSLPGTCRYDWQTQQPCENRNRILTVPHNGVLIDRL